MSTSPFLRGDEGFAKKSQLDAVSNKSKERRVLRLWLKAGEKANIVFLDGQAPFFLHEHNLKIGGKFGHYFTCTKELPGGCPLCDKGYKPVFTAYLTVIDTRSFERQDGSISKNRRVLYPAKGPTIEKVKNLISKYGDLRGKAFEVLRATADDPNCGRDFELLKEDVDLAQIPDSTPIPYEKVLAVPTREELAELGIILGVEQKEEKKEAPASQDLKAADLADLF